MNANKPDILLIQKYLNGELDARAMHQLERQALNDPFLQEALEGYGLKGNNQQQHLSQLQSRLQHRIAAPKKQRALWPVIGIAASVLVFLSVGGWWLLNYRKPANQPRIAPADNTAVIKKLVPPAPATPPPVTGDMAVLKPALPKPATEVPVEDTALITDLKIKKQTLPPPGTLSLSPAYKDTANNKISKLDEVIVMGSPVQKRTDITGSVAAITDTSYALPQTLQGRLAGVDISANRQVRIRGVATAAREAARTDSLKTLAGRVLAQSDGKPLPGVTILIINKNRGTQTDAAGNFKLKVNDKDELSINYIGFLTQRLKVKGKDSLTIWLKQSSQALAEVAIVSKENTQNTTKAHPQNGWDSFNQYLEQHAHTANGETGTVRITFTVNPNQTLTGFNIRKSLSPAADQQAIDLLENGPAWQPNANGKPQNITLKIKFK